MSVEYIGERGGCGGEKAGLEGEDVVSVVDVMKEDADVFIGGGGGGCV